jgi:non-specific serine/threonine protein kinase/serine/threonine-protein kinase
MEPSAAGSLNVTRAVDGGIPPTLAFGPYRLLQRIGEGGMGEVWVAEQVRPVRRQVALKIIKAGMDTAQVIARFEAERQALALMDHPAIATVFDGGSTPEGRPYFAMEYVKGEPITAYCDRHRLDTKARLALFILVCEGVQHAHQKGIIHRDLKPSNVLITLQNDVPVPKIIDFGVAKAITQHLTERTLFTELGVLIGTPEYMSPEQAELTGLDIDTRTDVYALGVLLYELLTGALPFGSRELRGKGLDEIRRTIREVEPPRPSTRITQQGPASADIATNRNTEPARLVGQVRGDLDWITMKALEKDRTRRYDTVAGLASDVRRHLKDEPVVAGPPSAMYRTKKFVRRHRFGVSAAALLAIVLVLFTTTMAVQAQRIAAERDRANREATRANAEAEAARQVTAFLTGLFSVSDPGEARGGSITAREVLDKGVQRIQTELADQPLVQARLMVTMGQVYQGLGLYERAESLQRSALALRQRLLGARAEETLQSLHSLGASLTLKGDYREAERVTREALEGRRLVLGPEHPETVASLGNLNMIFLKTGKWGEAERGYRQVLAFRERVLGPNHRQTLSAATSLAAVLQVQGKLDEAAALYDRSLAGFRKTVGPDHPSTLMTLYNLGSLAEHQDRWTDAARFYTDALEGRQRVLGSEHADTLTAAVALVSVRRAEGRFNEAEALARDALATARRTLPPSHDVTVSALLALGRILNARQRHVEARPLLEEALQMQRSLAPEDWYVAAAQCELGESRRGLGQLGAAEPLLVQGCSGVLESTAAGHAEKRTAAEHVVALYEALDKPAAAAEWRTRLTKQAMSAK